MGQVLLLPSSPSSSSGAYTYPIEGVMHEYYENITNDQETMKTARLPLISVQLILRPTSYLYAMIVVDSGNVIEDMSIRDFYTFARALLGIE
jgi:hypothetical protein